MDLNIDINVDTTSEPAKVLDELCEKYEIDAFKMGVLGFPIGNFMSIMGAENTKRLVIAFIDSMAAATATQSVDGLVAAHKHADPPKPPVA